MNVSLYKYLGIWLDDLLSFEDAVYDTYLKANRQLYTLRKINHLTYAKLNVQIIHRAPTCLCRFYS